MKNIAKSTFFHNLGGVKSVRHFIRVYCIPRNDSYVPNPNEFRCAHTP